MESDDISDFQGAKGGARTLVQIIPYGQLAVQPWTSYPTYLVSVTGTKWRLLLHKQGNILQARMLKWFAIPFSSGPHFVGTLHHDPSVPCGS